MDEVDLVDGVDIDDYFKYANWALETGIWDGRVITYKEAPDVHKKIIRSLVGLLFSEQLSIFIKLQQPLHG